MMLHRYLTILFIVVNSAPIILNQQAQAKYYLCASILICTLLLGTFFTKNTRKNAEPLQSETKVSKLVVGLILFTACVIYAAPSLGLFGLTERDIAREEQYNFNASTREFANAQLSYLLIGLFAMLVSAGIVKRNKLSLFSGISFSAVLLAATGTRWSWILCISPLLVFLISRATFGQVMALAGAGAIVLLSISATRGSGDNLSLLAAAEWDVPSFQSAAVIADWTPAPEDIVNFVYGHILILVPRFIWPEKPDDSATINYMISILDSRFFEGATILPGFLGSAWLYGGFVGIVFFSISLSSFSVFISNRFARAQNNTQNVKTLGLLGLLYFGTIFQLRGISVFYYLPAAYYLLIHIALRVAMQIAKRMPREPKYRNSIK